MPPVRAKTAQAHRAKQKSTEYLVQHRIGPLWEELLTSLLVAQPQNPVSFMLQHLEDKTVRHVLCCYHFR
jgi:hypothetical protein